MDPSEDGLWIIPPFDPEPKKPKGTEGFAGVSGDASKPTTVGWGGETTHEQEQETLVEGTVQRFVVQGKIPSENWAELFRCFVAPAVKMDLKELGLGVQFEMVLPENRALSENDQTFKAMKEAAAQLGLTLEINE